MGLSLLGLPIQVVREGLAAPSTIVHRVFGPNSVADQPARYEMGVMP
jgi:hypothetical protein